MLRPVRPNTIASGVQNGTKTYENSVYGTAKLGWPVLSKELVYIEHCILIGGGGTPIRNWNKSYWLSLYFYHLAKALLRYEPPIFGF